MLLHEKWAPGSLPQKSGFTLGEGQYRNAVASGRSQAYKSLSKFKGSRTTRRYRVAVLTVSNNDFRLFRKGIELNGPAEESNGIQITLFDDEASVTVPFWHHGAAARRVFEEIWTYLQIMEREGGFFTYDPQIDRVARPAKGF